MKKLYYAGLIALGLFEIANVYFIMPMPGSQQMNSLDLAYFLYTSRWIFRMVFGMFIVVGAFNAFATSRKWVPAIAAIPVLVIIYIFNFKMTADHMFLQPKTLVFKTREENNLNDSSIVVAVNLHGESKAYPIRYIQYHHQVRDTIAGKPIMVTYCNVCRTGRVFEPLVNGKPENFRLVGMDHFNAMFEDQTTGSWWRQATGEAVTGPLKGNVLPELFSNQLTLNNFFSLYPFGKVMQPETASKTRYDSLGRFEKGKSKGTLTRTDSLSWKDKSWVLGIEVNGKTMAYDWIQLKSLKILHDKIDDVPIVLIVSRDEQSFAAFVRPTDEDFLFRNDSLIGPRGKYDFAGRGIGGDTLRPLKVYQEFWHSWKQFHPGTGLYE